MRVGIGEMTAEMWVPLVGEVFMFVPSAGDAGASAEPTALELLDVSQYASRTRSGNQHPPREPFSLLFTLRSLTPLGKGLHRLVHEAFAPDDLLLSRVLVPGRDPRATYYEAVFG
jgi:uncharacterized protein DUF6916